MPGVAGGQDRRLLEVAQCLVAPGRVGVMVGVPLQVVQGHIGRDVVGVPAVAGVDTLVAFLAGCANLLAHHPVVLHVLDHLEERESHDSLDDEVRRDADTEPRDHRVPQHRRHQPRVEHVVADPERVLLLARVALLLDVPGTLEGTTDRTRPELVEVLAVPAAGGSSGVATRT